MNIRAVTKADAKQIELIIRETPEFSKGDRATCFECLDAYFGGDNTYHFDCAEEDGSNKITGFVCYGWDTIAEGILELYWIVVSKDMRRQHIASALQQHVEEVARKSKARMIFVETESNALYASTRKFYERSGYVEKARVKDFYYAGNDKVIYGMGI